MDFDQTQLLIYNHVIQLTLIDYELERAFDLAHEVAALAFDEEFTRKGLATAIERHEKPAPNKALSTDKAVQAATEEKS